jgi:aspartate/methionine/tyrosine aminotransferase
MATAWMACLDVGDEVLVPDPGFPNYAMAIQCVHGVPVPYSLAPEMGWRPSLKGMEKALTSKTKVLLKIVYKTFG